MVSAAPPPRGQADLAPPVEVARSRSRDYLILLRTPSYVLCTLGMAAMTFAFGGIGLWMPYYLAQRPGTGPSPATAFGVILALSGLTATLLGGWAGDKLRARFPGSYFLVSGVAMLAGFPLFLGVLITPFPLAWVLIFFACFTLFFNTGPTNTVLANVTHPAMRATGFALNIFVIHALGDVISPVLHLILTSSLLTERPAIMQISGCIALSIRGSATRVSTMSNRTTLACWLIVSTLAITFLAAGCASVPTVDLQSDDPEAWAQIERRLHEVFAAAESKDFDRLESYHLYGPKFTRFSGASVARQDAAATRKIEHDGLASLQGLKMRADALKIDVFGPVGIATFILDASFDSGGATVHRKDRSTLAFVKERGVWEIAHEHSSPIMLADGPANGSLPVVH